MATKAPTFTVTLKVGGDNIRLLIAVDDSLQEVFERLRQAYPNCSNKKTEILDKLVASLRLQLLNTSLNHSLLNSISQFLEKNDAEHEEDQQPYPNNHHSREKPQNANLHQKVLRNSLQNKQNQKACFKKRMSCQSQKQQVSQIPPKKSSVPSKPKLLTPSKSNKVHQTRGSAQHPKKCNPDVIKACELIMKKTHNTDMKQMAKEFLRQKGYLKEEKQKSMSQNKKKYTIHDSPQNDEKIQINPISTEKQEKCQINQSLRCDNSAILTNKTSVNVYRQNNRFGKYKYLQSSLINESLSKDYQQLNKEESSILKSGESKPKKYSYLD